MPRSYGLTNVAPYSSAPAVGTAGNTYFNTTDEQLYVSDGTLWNPTCPSDYELFVKTTAAQQTTSTTLIDIPGLSIPCAGGTKRYEFEVMLQEFTDGTTTGIQFAMQYSGTIAQFFGLYIISTSNSAAITGGLSVINFPPPAGFTTASARGTVWFRGMFITTTAGNITVRHAKVTSGTASCVQGSTMRVKDVS